MYEKKVWKIILLCLPYNQKLWEKCSWAVHWDSWTGLWTRGWLSLHPACNHPCKTPSPHTFNRTNRTKTVKGYFCGVTLHCVSFFTSVNVFVIIKLVFAPQLTCNGGKVLSPCHIRREVQRAPLFPVPAHEWGRQLLSPRAQLGSFLGSHSSLLVMGSWPLDQRHKVKLSTHCGGITKARSFRLQADVWVDSCRAILPILTSGLPPPLSVQ